MRRIPIHQKFLSKIKKLDNGCWEWTGKVRSGLPYMANESPKKGWLGARKYSYQKEFESDQPDGTWYVPTCDTELCVNPHHLTAYKPSARVIHREQKKIRREFKSAKNLTEDQIAELREWLHQAYIMKAKLKELTLAGLGDRVGISREAVRLIAVGRVHRSVGGPIIGEESSLEDLQREMSLLRAQLDRDLGPKE